MWYGKTTAQNNYTIMYILGGKKNVSPIYRVIVMYTHTLKYLV